MNTEKDTDLKRLEQHASALSEHYESVRIFVTRRTEDGKCESVSSTTGRGNYYAQLGQIHEWIVMQDALSDRQARRDAAEEDP